MKNSCTWNICEDSVWYVANLFWQQQDSFTPRLYKTGYIQLLKIVKDLQPEWRKYIWDISDWFSPLSWLEVNVRSDPGKIENDIEHIEEEESHDESQVDSAKVHLDHGI